MEKPLVIELYAGLHGWGEGFLAEGYRVIGFDIIDMCAKLGKSRSDGIQLVLQDVLTLHGRQLKDATVIVGSSPCQEFSYRAMPWKRAKGLPPPNLGIQLFNAQFFLQKEASEAAGRYIPLVVENVKGAQPWIGRARWHYGSYYLWGDVPAIMPFTSGQKFNPDGTNHGQGSWFKIADSINRGVKVPGMNWSDRTRPAQGFNMEVIKREGIKSAQDELGGYGGSFGWNNTPIRRGNSRSDHRKAASAAIAKIPFPLARHIARCFKP